MTRGNDEHTDVRQAEVRRAIALRPATGAPPRVRTNCREHTRGTPVRADCDTIPSNGPERLHQDQPIEIIEWLDGSRDTPSYRFPDEDREIKRGAQLLVRESQVAQFVYLGQLGDTFGPGRHTLTTDNIPCSQRCTGGSTGSKEYQIAQGLEKGGAGVAGIGAELAIAGSIAQQMTNAAASGSSTGLPELVGPAEAAKAVGCHRKP